MKNIILVSLPKVETNFPPAALSILASVAKENGRGVKIFDYNLDLFYDLSSDEWDDLESWLSFSMDHLSLELENKLHQIFIDRLKEIVDAETEFVCFSVFSYFSNRIAAKVLEWYPGVCSVPTIIGGSGISTDISANNKEIFGEHIVKNKLANYVIFGEGEVTLERLLNGCSDYPGININNPVQIEDLTALPIPTYEYFDMPRYQNKKILITGSRGCVRKCTFCDIELTWPQFRYRKAEHIVEEMERHFDDYGVTEFEFTDSLINGSISNFDRFNELLYNRKQLRPELAPIKYQGQFICRPSNQQRERSYELMHLAGCTMLITGIESFSNNVRNHMKKKFSDDDISYHLEQCGRWNIPNVLLMIVGYPTETLEDHQANLNALRRYKTYADMGTIFMVRWGFTMHLYEHTPIMNMVDELQISLESNIKFDSLYGWTSGLNPGNTLRERIRRRLEIHELSVELGYPMPRVKEELLILKKLAERSKEFTQAPAKIFELRTA
jgi:hypothetical protein